MSRDYVKKIRKHQLRYGQMERVPQTRHGPISRVTAEVKHQLRVELRAQPDLTLWELGQRLQKACASPQSKTHQEQCILKSSLISEPNLSVVFEWPDARDFFVTS